MFISAGNLCGFSAPKPALNSGNTMLVHFQSDGENGFRGFRAWLALVHLLAERCLLCLMISTSSAAILRYLSLFFRLILLPSVKVTLKQNSYLYQSSPCWIREVNQVLFFLFSWRNEVTNICYLKQAVLLIPSVWYFPWKPHYRGEPWTWGPVYYCCFLLLWGCACCCLRRWATFPFQNGDFFWEDKPELLTQVRANSYFLPLTEGAGRERSGLTAPMLCLKDVPLGKEVNLAQLIWSEAPSFNI